jgi:hypothetical protein
MNNNLLSDKIKILLLIYIGTIFYALASFFHLSIKEWSFKKAFLIAMPLVAIEYIFTLNGNKKANEILKFNPLQILLITMSFYFINIWLLNYFIIKNKINPIREIISFIFILAAFSISNNIKI